MLNERLVELRKSKNFSQDYMADKLGVKRQTYGAYERNVSSPDVQTLIKLSDIFEVTVDYLLGREKKSYIEDASKYESALSKYGPTADELNDTITQILEHGINLEKPSEVIELLLKLNSILFHLCIALNVPADIAKEIMLREKLELLEEIPLDGSPPKKSENPSNMLYMLSYLSIHIDKANSAKNELTALLDEFLRTYTSMLLSLRYRLAAMNEETEQECTGDKSE